MSVNKKQFKKEKVMNKLQHKTIYRDTERIEVSLPLCDVLKSYHIEGSFPLVEDPNIHKKACIIGMFVLRPALVSWTDSILDENGIFKSAYDIIDSWSYNFEELEGGWLIANGNVVDAFRLALQYGTSDAVIVGTRTVVGTHLLTLCFYHHFTETSDI
jgi:hypothetical protein